VRAKWPALIVIAAVFLTAATPLFGADGSHRNCAPQPDCHKTARITCCHFDHRDLSDQPGLTQDRTELSVDQHVIVAVLPESAPPHFHAACSHTDTSPPFGPPRRLPILLADLRL
jgi:hypothetical protein